MRTLPKNSKRKTEPEQNLTQESFAVELTIGAESPFSDVLLGAIDDAFASLGGSAKSAIFYHLENSMGIKRSEIPFRLDDFQDALERIFGIGARHLEIMFLANLHQRLRTEYDWNLPRGFLPELTFQKYVELTRKSFENSDCRRKENRMKDTTQK